MANIALRKETAPVTPQQPLYEPLRVMRELLGWDPFREMRALTLPNLPTFNMTELNFVPAFEVKETKDSFVFRADVPGVKDTDIDISISGDRLTVSGKRETEHTDKDDTWYAYERTYGSFARTFTLPSGADVEHARAELEKGVLSLILPKKPEMQARKISIKAGEKVKA